jgi:hypothetical protein
MFPHFPGYTLLIICIQKHKRLELQAPEHSYRLADPIMLELPQVLAVACPVREISTLQSTDTARSHFSGGIEPEISSRKARNLNKSKCKNGI